MHILPQLRKLERKYRDTLAVIGVHSAKFTNEKETANVREAVMRYGIEHPVVNDRDFAVWGMYSVRAWPTLMFIDPAGKVIGKHEGEFDFDGLDRVISDMVREFDASGLLDRRLLEFQLEAVAAEKRPLSFPGKVITDPAGSRLFIADSGHHRVLVADMTGKVTAVIGSGEPGASDGIAADAQFNNPQGMALGGSTLYVADAGNHTIRSVDLAVETVATVAGTGEQALFRHVRGAPLANPLNSPYDLALGPSTGSGTTERGPSASLGATTQARSGRTGVLYIAMAGFHQLWALDLAEKAIAPFAGDGREDIVDGPRLEARLAQPYGVAVTGGTLYFADSETSAVRSVNLSTGRVETLVGTGLFDFGDRDGTGTQAQLQHAQGIAVGDGKVFVADTYNHKVKVIDPATKKVSTLAGTGVTGRQDGPADRASFNEPAGLAYASGWLYIADTNNHTVRVLDLSKMVVSTLEIEFRKLNDGSPNYPG